jgi:hypothetical protein
MRNHESGLLLRIAASIRTQIQGRIADRTTIQQALRNHKSLTHTDTTCMPGNAADAAMRKNPR